MKKFLLCTIALVVWFTQVTGAYAESSDAGKWRYAKDINLAGTGKYKAFYLDEEVYRYSNSDLSDLRIKDGRGEFVSYYLQDAFSYERQGKITYSAVLEDKFRLKDRQLEKNDTFIDFRLIPDKEGADFQVNKLVIKDLPGHNFYKNIEVYGSFDGVEWQLAARDSIYKVDNKSKVSVNFDETKKFEFYRIKILQNLEKIQFCTLEAEYDFTEKIRKNFIKTADMKSNIESKEKQTVITLDNPSRLKLKNIILDVPGNFSRRYEIRVKGEDEFVSAGASGEIYNVIFKDYKISKKNIELPSGGMNSEKLQVVIFNQDDRPLQIASVKVDYLIAKAVFEDSATPPYRLVFGNPEASRPSYDIDKYNVHIENEGQDICSLEKAAVQETEEAGVAAVNYKLLLNIVMGVLSVGLILLIARKLGGKAKP